MGLRIAMIALAVSFILKQWNFWFQPLAHCLCMGFFSIGGHCAIVSHGTALSLSFYLRHLWAPMGGDVQKFAWISVFSVLIEIGINTLDVQMLSMLTDMNSVGIYGMAFFHGLRNRRYSPSHQPNAGASDFDKLE